jgi:Fe2+ or Zn2+ uptake regulation protein
VAPPNTNRPQPVEFPPVAIRKYRKLHGSCREAILDVLADTDAAAGEPMTCNDVLALLQANDAVHSVDTIYKALRRMADDGILTWAEGPSD